MDPEVYQTAMSLSFFSGRTLTAVDAGLALNITSSLVKGLMPLRALTAGLRTVLILSRPGRTNSPTAFFLMWDSMTSVRLSSTAETCLRVRDVVWATSSRIWVFEKRSLMIATFFAMPLDL
jgi:hypothetical protein